MDSKASKIDKYSKLGWMNKCTIYKRKYYKANKESRLDLYYTQTLLDENKLLKRANKFMRFQARGDYKEIKYLRNLIKDLKSNIDQYASQTGSKDSFFQTLQCPPRRSPRLLDA